MNRITCLLAVSLVLITAMSPTYAGVGKIVGLSEALEADKIAVILDKNKHSGEVIITDCESCPLELKLTGKSKLFYKNEKLSRKDLWKVGGKPGTVFYDKTSKRVQKIKW